MSIQRPAEYTRHVSSSAHPSDLPHSRSLRNQTPKEPSVAKASSRASVKGKPISSNHKGRPIHNEILSGLPRKEFNAVLAALEFVDLPVRTTLNEPGEAITSCYFVNSGLVSILSVLSQGKSVEVGLTGKEGFVGLPLVAGLKTSGARAIVQIPATAFR